MSGPLELSNEFFGLDSPNEPTISFLGDVLGNTEAYDQRGPRTKTLRCHQLGLGPPPREWRNLAAPDDLSRLTSQCFD